MPRPRCHVPCSGRRPGRPPTPCSRSAAAAPAVAAHRRPACRRRPGGDSDATGAAVWPAAGCRLVDPAHQQRDVLPGDVLANGTVPTGAVGQCVGDRAQCLLAVAHLGVIRSDSMDDLAEGTVLHLQLDGGAHELVQCMCRVLRLRQTFAGRSKGVQLLGDNHRQKIVLGGEVPEDGALADPGALRDLRDRHLSALLGECLRRRVDQELPGADGVTAHRLGCRARHDILPLQRPTPTQADRAVTFTFHRHDGQVAQIPGQHDRPVTL